MLVQERITVVVLSVLLAIGLASCAANGSENERDQQTSQDAGVSSPVDDSTSRDDAAASPNSAQPAIETEEVTVYFPRMADDAEYVFTDDKRTDRLSLDDRGCLRFGEGGPLIIWPVESFSVELINGAVTVTHANGEPLVRVGESLSLIGSPASPDILEQDRFVLDTPPPNACLEDGEIIVPSAEVEAVDRVNDLHSPDRRATDWRESIDEVQVAMPSLCHVMLSSLKHLSPGNTEPSEGERPFDSAALRSG